MAFITSATGSGSQFVIDRPFNFFDGYGFYGRSGDTLKTVNGQVTTIIDINNNTGAVSVNPSISWTQNEGIGLEYEVSTWDIGYDEYSETGIAVTITATDSASAEEGQETVEFTFSCSPNCSATEVNYRFSGGTVLDTDYNCTDEDGTITITGSSDTITCIPADDRDPENPETVNITVNSGSGYSVGSPSQATATITDNDGGQGQSSGGISIDSSGSGQITYSPSGSGSWSK